MTRLVVAALVLVGCRGPVVLRWLTDWEAARACMLATPEYGPDSETAFATSSFVKDTSCATERVRLIAIRDEDWQAIPGWEALREDLRALEHYQASAIDRIDARVVQLRRAAHLPRIERVRRYAPIELPAAREYEEPPDAGPVFREAIALPSRSWSASADGDVLHIHDEHGHLELQLPGEFWTGRAMDRGASRLVMLQRQSHTGGFAVAISRDGGPWRVEQSRDGLPYSRSSQDSKSGTIDIVVESEGRAFLQRFDEIALWPDRVEIPKPVGAVKCRADDVLYLATATHLVRWASKVSIIPTGAFHDVVTCNRSSALLIDRGASYQELRKCSDGGCTVVHRAPHNFRSAAALLPDGTWLFAAANGSIVGVWREGVDEPAFYRLQKPGWLEKLRVSGETVELILAIDGVMQAVVLPGH